MASGNINMRDPVLYRILNAPHPRTGTAWHIYPSYDFAHGQSDAIEARTPLCTLEFADHRPLYDWFIDNLPVLAAAAIRVRAAEPDAHGAFQARADRACAERPRVGLGRPAHADARGAPPPRRPPEAIREFVRRIGVARADNLVDVAMLDHAIRDVLNRTAPRRMAVLRPLKVVIENYPEGATEELDAVNNPEDPSAGSRRVRFSGELYIERDDFMENPPKKFFRLSPGQEVRLRYAYFVRCRDVVKNDAGEVVELRCTYDPETRGGNTPPDGRKVKATLHWVSAADAVPAEIRLVNQLFRSPSPDVANFAADLNPDLLEVLSGAMLEPAAVASNSDEPMQFERQGYFRRDRDSSPGRPVFVRTVGLRDTFAKALGQGGATSGG